MPKPENKFVAAMKPQAEAPDIVAAASASTIAVAERATLQNVRPSRKNTKHIGGYFDPAVSKQLRAIAVEEDTSVQALLAEGIDLVFQSRRKPTIAKQAGAQ